MAAGKILQIKRGVAGSLVALAAGELGLTTDTKLLYIGNGATNDLVGGIGVVRDVAAGITLLNADLTLKNAPSTDLMAATKKYVDDKAAASAAGLDIKDSVRAATIAAGTLATSFANGSVIDTVTLATGNRILIKNQASGVDNGIYTVNASGAPTRATDFATGVISAGAFCFIEEGSQADTGWIMTNTGVVTVGTSTLVFTQFNAAGTGNVVGPASNYFDNELVLFNGLTGKLIKGSNTAVSAYGLALIDDGSFAAQLITLGLTATAAELNQLDGITLTGNNSGDQTLSGLGGIASSIFTAKGNLLAASASATPVAIAIDTDGKVLTAHSAAASGIDWETLIAFDMDFGAFA